MPANPRQIRRRIQSVKNTQKITKAMKMVSAARLRRAEERVRNVRPYVEKMEVFLARLVGSVGTIPHPLAEVRPVVHSCVVVIGSDRGLCGSYNSNIFRAAEEHIRSVGREKAPIITVGRRARDYFRRRGYNVVASHINLDVKLDHREVSDLRKTIETLFLSGKADEVQLFYSAFKSAAVCRPTQTRYLPLDPKVEEGERETAGEFIYEPDPETLLGALFSKYIHSQMYLFLAEAFASEMGQRMVAMSNATENAGEMIQSLTLTYNRVRQAAITKEILEIVGGAEALKG